MSALKERWRKILFWLIVLQIAGTVAFIGALLVGEATRPTFTALYVPRQPLLVGNVLALLVTRFTRRRVKTLYAINAVLFFVVLFPVMGLRLGSARTPTRTPIRLASYNVYFGKMNRAKLLDELAAMDVQILLIQAPHESMRARLRERFPDRSVESFDDFILVSKLKVRELVKPKPITEDDTAKYAAYVLETEAGPLTIYNVHPYSPRYALLGADMESNVITRELQIDAAVTAASANGGPYLIVGDTNLPPMSAIARRRLSGLTDAWEDVGFGFGYTFPAKRPWLRLDRAFASEGVRFLDIRVGPLGESDHRPIFVDFEIVSGH